MGSCLILLLQIAAFFGPSSAAKAQQVCTNDQTFVFGSDTYRDVATYYCSTGVRHGFWKQWKYTTLIHSWNYVDGVLNGLYQDWYDTGLNQEIGVYVDGVKFIGESWVWHANGRMREHWESLGDSATDTQWYDDGRMQSYSEYLDGRLYGMSKTWATNSARTETQFVDGQKHGLEVKWNVSDQKVFEGRYEYGQIISSIAWTYTGSVLTIEDPKDGDGNRHGLFKVWYPSGQVKAIEPYSHGKLHGVYQSWHENGQLEGVREFHNGKREGAFTFWWDNGNPRLQTVYINDLPHGSCRSWWYNGNRQMEFQYANGQQCGIWIYYQEDGSYLSHYDYGAGSSDIPTEPDPQARNTSARRVSGVVYDARTSKPISGASVNGALSASDGSYSLIIGSPNTYSLSCTKPGYDRFGATLNMEGIQLRTLNIRLKRMVSANLPSVASVEPVQSGIYLFGVSMPAEYLAQVQWNGLEPGAVIFDVAGTKIEVPASASGVTNAFDMGGAPFLPNTDPVKNRIKVVARSKTGELSRPEYVYPAVIPIPSWSQSVGTFLSQKTNNLFVYASKSKWPAEPVKISIDPESLGPIVWKAWSLFPIIGGRNFGIPPTQFFLDTEVKTDGKGSLAAGGISGFEAMGGEVAVKLGGKGHVLFKPNFGMEMQRLSVLIGCDGTMKKSVGVVTVIPALEGAVNLPLLGRPIAWFNSLAQIEAKFYTGFELELPVAAKDRSLAFGSAFNKIKAGLTLGLIGGVNKQFKGEVSGGGELALFMQTPPLGGKHYLTKAEAKLIGQLLLTVWSYQKRYAFEHVWANEWKEGASAQSLDAEEPDRVRRSYELDGPGFVPISASSFAGPDFNSFVANRSALRAQSLDAADAAESVIIHSAYPYSDPSLAALDDRLAIAYVTFNTNQPAVRATDICLTYSGAEGQFSTPVAVTNDTRADFSPAAAFADSNTVVVAWQRVKDPAFTETNDLPQMAQAMEMVWAAYSVSAARWGPIHALTDNAHLDHSPMLSRSPDGTVLLAWVANQGNELIGTTNAPDRVWYAFWNSASNTFAAPTCVPRDLVACSDYRIANYGQRGLLAYSQDLDGVLFATNSTGGSIESTDRELFTLRIQDTNSFVPKRVTTNNVADVSPAPRFDSAGEDHLVWLSGSNLVRLSGLESLPSLVRESSDPSANFRAIARNDDRVVLVWPGVETNGMDLYYRSYDPGYNSWSEDRRLTQNPQVEWDFEGGFAFSNRLCLVYLKKDASITNTDLCILTRSLTHDLAIALNGLRCDPVTPTPGQPLTMLCLVTNRGDYPVSNLTCSFHLGSTGAIPLATLSLSNTVLRAGAATNLVWQWTAPADTNTPPLAAFVNATGPLSDMDEANNVASLSLFLPDLEVLDTRIDPSVEGSAVAVAVVRNNGAVCATNLFVRFDAESRLLVVKQAPDLLPGNTIELGHKFSPALDFTNATGLVSVTVDPGNLVAESNETNNRGEVFAFMNEDSNANGIPDGWEQFHLGTLVDANDDADGDGASNLQEYWSQTSPTDPADYFRVQESPPVQGGTNLVLEWNTQPGWQYSVYMTTNVATSNEWRLVGAGVATDDKITVTNRSFNLPEQFYKVRISP